MEPSIHFNLRKKNLNIIIDWFQAISFERFLFVHDDDPRQLESPSSW
jgi:hypothetical protein